MASLRTPHLWRLQALTAKTKAVGGDVGVGGYGGVGGNAKAVTTATSGAGLSALAKAHGGASGAKATLAAHASAKVKVSGASGTFKAVANTSLAAGQLVTAVSAVAAGAVNGAMTAKTKVTIGDPALAFATGGQAVAFESGAPDAASTGGPHGQSHHRRRLWGLANLFGHRRARRRLRQERRDGLADHHRDGEPDGGSHPARRAPGPWWPVSMAPRLLGAGFTSLVFTLTGDGAVLLTKTFATAAAAQNFFSGKTRDLGSLATGALSGDTLTLQASFTLTTTAAGQGFYAQVIIGDPPPAASPVSRFTQAMAGLGGLTGGSPINVAEMRTWSQSLLSAPGAHRLA